MNKDEEIEILEVLDKDTSTNKQGFSSNDSSGDLGKQDSKEVSEPRQFNDDSSSRVSPFISKPNIVGTTAHSPRISVNSTFVSQHQNSKSSFGQQEDFIPKESNHFDEHKNKDEVQILNTNSNKRFTPILLVILFVVLLGTILFLPYSEKLFDKFLFSKNNGVSEQTITNGRLICTMEGDDFTNSYRYTETYSFDNGEVDSLEHEVLIQGNADYLNTRNQQCQLLQQVSSSFSGITVACDLTREEMKETQVFNLSLFNSNSINAAFTESGGVTPNAKKGDDYKEVKRIMEISGYDCKIK